MSLYKFHDKIINFNFFLSKTHIIKQVQFDFNILVSREVFCRSCVLCTSTMLRRSIWWKKNVFTRDEQKIHLRCLCVLLLCKQYSHKICLDDVYYECRFGIKIYKEKTLICFVVAAQRKLFPPVFVYDERGYALHFVLVLKRELWKFLYFAVKFINKTNFLLKIDLEIIRFKCKNGLCYSPKIVLLSSSFKNK